MKVTMVAPFEVKGRYKGGISVVANSIIEQEKLLKKYQMEILTFNTCRIQRNIEGNTRFNIENILNFFKLYKDLIRNLNLNYSEVVYYHSSINMALLKDLLCIRNIKKTIKTKVILHIHYADYEKIMPKKKFIEKVMLNLMNKYVDEIVFLSKKTESEFWIKGINKEKTSVIYNFSKLNILNDELLKKWNNQEKKYHFLFVGSLDERKGIIDLLKVLSEIKNDDYVLEICGEFSNEEIKKQFEKYRDILKDKIIFHGYVNGEKKKNIYLNADVLLLPSYGEGLPLVIMEAFQSGCAVVSTEVGAIPEIVSKKNGFLYKAGNCKKLKEILEDILKDKKRLEEIQKYNVKDSMNYSIEKFIEKMSNACKKVLNI